MMKATRKLKALAAKLAEVCWDGGSVDGEEMKEWLVNAGVLTVEIVDEPCSPNCRCRACDPTPPWVCYRLSEPFK
jgi:hypothetical protein